MTDDLRIDDQEIFIITQRLIKDLVIV